MSSKDYLPVSQKLLERKRLLLLALKLLPEDELLNLLIQVEKADQKWDEELERRKLLLETGLKVCWETWDCPGNKLLRLRLSTSG